MTSSTLLRLALAVSTAAAIAACQPAEPAAEPAQEPAAAGSAATDEPTEPASMGHDDHDDHDESGHAAGGEAPPADMAAAGDEASGADGHMDHGGMNMPELGEYDPADWSDQPGAEVGDVTRCPVSGEEFRVTEDSTFFEHNGQNVYFCCAGCIRQFQRNPDALLAAAFPAEGSGE